MHRFIAALGLTALLAPAAFAASGPQTPIADPFGSGMWGTHQKYLLGDPEVIAWDDRVQVLAPDAAEDSLNVPLLVDASAIPNVKRIVVSADYGPIPHILTYFPEQAQAKIALRFKIDMATEIRASVETHDGTWHVGGTYIDAAGGGCTQPAAAYAADDWEEHLGKVQGRLWSAAGRAHFVVDHPMDTGLAGDIPVFIIEDLALATEAGEMLARIELKEPVNEDPAFTLYFEQGSLPPAARLTGRDNNGNRIDALLTEGGTH